MHDFDDASELLDDEQVTTEWVDEEVARPGADEGEDLGAGEGSIGSNTKYYDRSVTSVATKQPPPIRMHSNFCPVVFDALLVVNVIRHQRG